MVVICLLFHLRRTATIPLESRDGISSTGGSSNEQRAQQTQMSCQVCHLAASNGLHFGARTCAACAAFFRRSISDQKRYICKRSQRCVIKPNESGGEGFCELLMKIIFHVSAQGYRKMCRNCRMRRCLEIGMLPESE
jgi:hepatocyte nuclear factor 4